jgi:hypothetical protein
MTTIALQRTVGVGDNVELRMVPTLLRPMSHQRFGELATPVPSEVKRE